MTFLQLRKLKMRRLVPECSVFNTDVNGGCDIASPLLTSGFRLGSGDDILESGGLLVRRLLGRLPWEGLRWLRVKSILVAWSLRIGRVVVTMTPGNGHFSVRVLGGSRGSENSDRDPLTGQWRVAISVFFGVAMTSRCGVERRHDGSTSLFCTAVVAPVQSAMVVPGGCLER